MSLVALKKLVESSKASVLVAVLVVLGALLYANRITTAQFLDTLTLLVPSWMAAHAAERGLTSVGERKKAAAAAAETEEEDKA